MFRSMARQSAPRRLVPTAQTWRASGTYGQRHRSSKYRNGKDKRGTHPAGNHFILTGSQQRVIGAEMIADGLTVDDGAKCTAEVVHMIAAIAFLNHKMVAR